ncbi:MAG: hypothetical protein MSG64_19075 [Pyrinomonadaceae bacterium MAG19_C2-C3]|nr:hypothetical protein [Pyrinomonadaceae bacterium MAG19_C2-C3]
MSDNIKHRDDVNPKEGEGKYGDVEFANPVNNKYPIDTPEHIRAAWSYINHKDNAAKYETEEVKILRGASIEPPRSTAYKSAKVKVEHR